MIKKTKTTYDRLMQDPEFKEMYKESYHEFVLSELLLAIMAEDKISIRKLAKEAGISPTTIQEVRSGKKDNLTLKTFSTLLDALGYDLVIEKRQKENKEPNLPKRLKMKMPGGLTHPSRRSRTKRTKQAA